MSIQCVQKKDATTTGARIINPTYYSTGYRVVLYMLRCGVPVSVIGCMLLIRGVVIVL